jgi:hypothetical protein
MTGGDVGDGVLLSVSATRVITGTIAEARADEGQWVAEEVEARNASDTCIFYWFKWPTVAAGGLRSVGSAVSHGQTRGTEMGFRGRGGL